MEHDFEILGVLAMRAAVQFAPQIIRFLGMHPWVSWTVFVAIIAAFSFVKVIRAVRTGRG